MKKLALVGFITAGLCSSAFAAGMEFNPRPYVGADYVFNKVNTGDDSLVKNHSQDWGLTAGVQFNEYLGLEAFYSQNISNMGEKNTGYDLRLKNWGMLVTGQYNLQNNFYLKAAAGFAVTNAKEKLHLEWDDSNYHYEANAKMTSRDTAFAGKLGMGYNFTSNIATEVTYNHLDHRNGLGLEVKYKF